MLNKLPLKKLHFVQNRLICQRKIIVGIACCGLACCLCSKNEHCSGCNLGDGPDKDFGREPQMFYSKGNNMVMSVKRIAARVCYRKISCIASHYLQNDTEKNYYIVLNSNKQNGVVYHRKGIVGDYDVFDNIEKLITFIRTRIVD